MRWLEPSVNCWRKQGFKAERWRKMVRYFASPGFLGEWMQVFIAEGLTLGEAQPEYDEQIGNRDDTPLQAASA